MLRIQKSFHIIIFCDSFDVKINPLSFRSYKDSPPMTDYLKLKKWRGIVQNSKINTVCTKGFHKNCKKLCMIAIRTFFDRYIFIKEYRYIHITIRTGGPFCTGIIKIGQHNLFSGQKKRFYFFYKVFPFFYAGHQLIPQFSTPNFRGFKSRSQIIVTKEEWNRTTLTDCFYSKG